MAKTSYMGWDYDAVLFVLDQHAWLFLFLAYWNNKPRVHMSLYTDTYFWLWANQYLCFYGEAAFNIPIL
jgi:membrane-bound acyltransferase YfiQ involved in biofilm formation